MTEDRRQRAEGRRQRIGNRRQRTDEKGLKTELGWQMSIKSIKDLEVYQLAFDLAMKVFELTKKFPKEETYSLTDQIRRSS